MLNTQVFADVNDLAEAAADFFIQAAKAAIQSKGRFTVALSGGRTPRYLFDCLTQHTEAGSVPWSQCVFFWVDERYVPVTDDACNFKMAKESLLEPLGIPETNIHRMLTELALDEAVSQYEQILHQAFSLNPGDTPVFDLIQLGMGADGHTGSLFPHSFDLKTERLVAWTVPPEAPHHRITLTPRVLTHASQLMVLLTGKDKASMVKTVFTGELDCMSYPIRLLWPVLDRVTWWLDGPAASQL